jgi:nickel-dependent lactate racemase
VVGIKTIMHLHNAAMIGDPRSTWAQLAGNPVQGEIREAVALAPPHFMVNVAINPQREITALWAGHYIEAHELACRAVAEHATRAVEELFEIVITTNSGYPLDQNLYQAVKGMSAASEVVRPGGLIVCAAECRDGFPDHGSYRSALEASTSPQQLLDEIAARDHTRPDQWQIQVQAKIQTQARVGVHTAGLTADELRTAHLQPVPDIAEAVERELAERGDDAWVCVLPEGPQTIPYVA